MRRRVCTSSMMKQKVRDALTLHFCRPLKDRVEFPMDSAEEYLTSDPLKEPACILLDNQLLGMSAASNFSGMLRRC